MHILYVHQNYPAQFGHLAKYLIKHHHFRCTFVTQQPARVDDGVRVIQYKTAGGARQQTNYFSRSFENYTWHSQAVYETLKAHPDIKPDLVVGHSGFGSTVFLADLFDAPIVNYFEYHYRSNGQDDGFRPDQPGHDEHRLRSRARNAMILLDLRTCTLGYSPTNWQRSLFPNEFQFKLRTVFDGINTELWRRDEGAVLGHRVIGGKAIPATTRIVTYVSRGFETIRGFDVFLQIAKRLIEQRNDCVFVCVGTERVCYGNDDADLNGKSYRRFMLEREQVDLSRFLFTGRVPPQELARILNLSDLHIYLTEPFILSWSMMNAMACGCTILASATPPVAEMIQHGRNGLLADFFDVDAFVELANQVLDDPQAYRYLGRIAMGDIADRYSTERIAPKVLDLYNDALGRKGSRPHGTRAAGVPRRQTPERIPTAVERLAAAHAWPADRPLPACDTPKPSELAPPDRNRAALKLIALRLSAAVPVVVDLTARLGFMTYHLAGLPERPIVVAVDHWTGAVQPGREAQATPGDRDHEHPRHYDVFLAACWDRKHRIIPIRATSDEALAEIADYGIRPDVVFINAVRHAEVERLLRCAHHHCPGAKLVGVHWSGEAGRGATRFVERNELELEVRDDCWCLWSERTSSNRLQPISPPARRPVAQHA